MGTNNYKKLEIPLVSVVMPAYNCTDYIKNAIESVLVQEVPLELIIINDCSKDDLDGLMKQYESNDCIIYLKNEKNMGAAASRNKGVRLARGNYVAFLDSDDWWEKGKLKRQIQLLDETGAVLCGTGRELITKNGSLTGKIITSKKREVSYKTLLYGNIINCSSVLVLTDIIKKYPMEYEESHEDYITWLKILKNHGNAVLLEEPLLKYRLTADGKSGSKLNSAKMHYKALKYIGFNPIKASYYFMAYAINGVIKYL